MSDHNKQNLFLHHMHFLPLESQTWHELRTLAMATELCKLTRHLFESRLRPIKGLYSFLCNLGDNDIHAKDLVALACTCVDLAELFIFHIQHTKQRHEAAVINGDRNDSDTEDDFLRGPLVRNDFSINDL
jgi:hypothetical protein